MEDLKELMDGKYEIIERYVNRIINSANRSGYFKAQIDLCDIHINGSDDWEKCKYYIRKRNMIMSCRMHEQDSLKFYKNLLNEYINV